MISTEIDIKLEEQGKLTEQAGAWLDALLDGAERLAAERRAEGYHPTRVRMPAWMHEQFVRIVLGAMGEADSARIRAERAEGLATALDMIDTSAGRLLIEHCDHCAALSVPVDEGDVQITRGPLPNLSSEQTDDGYPRPDYDDLG